MRLALQGSDTHVDGGCDRSGSGEGVITGHICGGDVTVGHWSVCTIGARHSTQYLLNISLALKSHVTQRTLI